MRERADDIPLAAYFLAGLNAEYRRNVRLSPAALKGLVAYPSTGNVRQLRGSLESAVAMSDGDVLEPRDFHLTSEIAGSDELPSSLNLEHVEAWAIRKALRKADGVHTQAAKELGMHRDTLVAS